MLTLFNLNNFSELVPKNIKTNQNKLPETKTNNVEKEPAWLWNQAPIDQIPKEFKSFVYLITNKITQKQYIGFKTAVSPKTKISHHKKQRVVVESQWKTYWSSSDVLQKEVTLYGKSNFIREIVVMCPNKATGKYLEAYLQFQRGVIGENAGRYYNGIINLRINKNSIKQLTNCVWCTSPLIGDSLIPI